MKQFISSLSISMYSSRLEIIIPRPWGCIIITTVPLPYNIDLCGYPHEEEEILPPKELIQQYQEKRASLNADIDRILAQITDILGIDITEEGDE